MASVILYQILRYLLCLWIFGLGYGLGFLQFLTGVNITAFTCKCKHAHTCTHTHTAPDVRLSLGSEVERSVKHISLHIGSRKMQRRMKCSMWSSDYTLSYFILTSSFHQLTASVLNFSSWRGCTSFIWGRIPAFIHYCRFPWPFATVNCLWNSQCKYVYL